MSKVDVSIIIPVYNVEQYIEECLDSVINQTHSNIEIIVIEDCSTDNSKLILENYAKRDKRIQLINHIQNQGQGIARNKGIEYVRGEYVLFVDSDDYIAPESVEVLLEKAKKENTDILFCDYYKIKSNRTKIVSTFALSTVVNGKEYMYYAPFLDILVWNKLWKTSFLKEYKLKFVKEKFEDVIFTNQAIGLAKRVYSHHFPFYYYRTRENSTMTSNVNKNHIVSQFNLFKILEEEYLKSKGNIDEQQRLKSFLYSFAGFTGFLNRYQPLEFQEKAYKEDIHSFLHKKYSEYKKEIFSCKKLGLIQRIALYISPNFFHLLIQLKNKKDLF